MTHADASAAASAPALRLVGIEKWFGEVRAVAGASLDVAMGTLHAVVGENGAGKSTLLKIAAGALPADGGEVWVAGVRQASYDARRGQELGIAMVQQHFALFEGLTVLENLMVGAEATRSFGRLDSEEGAARASVVLHALGTSLPLDEKVGALGVGDKQRLEIARALYRDARIIILDEPTAVLTPFEATTLYATLRRLAREGRAVVVVTHHLGEVEENANVVTVMRRGESVGTRRVVRGEDAARIAAEILAGESAGAPPPPRHHRPGGHATPLLSVSDLAQGRALHGVSFDVDAGEIVGIAGVLGNGQSELVGILGGLLVADAGGVKATSLEVVHEDRQTSGLVLDASVAENLVLGELASFTQHGLVDDRKVLEAATQRIADFDVRPPRPAATVRGLSGGNQQKIVIGRALARRPAVLVVAHPTRGVDLLAARAIHAQISEAADRGTAVVIVSADLEELRLLCARILVMFRGRVVAVLPPTADDATLGAAMLGTLESA